MIICHIRGMSCKLMRVSFYEGNVEMDVCWFIKIHNLIYKIKEQVMMMRSLRFFAKIDMVGLSMLPKFQFARKKLNTQVFEDLTWKELATPQLTKKLINKPIHMHSRVSQKSLYHQKRVRHHVRTCFSEKKTKVFRRVNKKKLYYFSEILNRKIFVTVSMKAFKCIRKMGSFDNYILCSKPEHLDSKFGEYLREIMLRKINDDTFRVPYIIGTDRKGYTKSYKKAEYIKRCRVLKIPQELKDNFRTFQKKFGTTPDELNEENYKKYTELQELKRKLGKQLDPAHPLILELREKMSSGSQESEEKRANEMAEQRAREYLAVEKHQEYRKMRVERAKKEIELMDNKLRQYAMDMSQIQL